MRRSVIRWAANNGRPTIAHVGDTLRHAASGDALHEEIDDAVLLFCRKARESRRVCLSSRCIAAA